MLVQSYSIHDFDVIKEDFNKTINCKNHDLSLNPKYKIKKCDNIINRGQFVSLNKHFIFFFIFFLILVELKLNTSIG